MPEGLNFDARRLIMRMLSVDPNKRPTIKEVRIKFKLTNSYVPIAGLTNLEVIMKITDIQFCF